jgi:hypothetical protein
MRREVAAIGRMTMMPQGGRGIDGAGLAGAGRGEANAGRQASAAVRRAAEGEVGEARERCR